MYFATITAHGPHYGPEDLQTYYKKKYETEEFAGLRQRFQKKSEKLVKSGKAKKGHDGVASFPYDHAADVANVDRNVGRLMAQLKKLDLLKNTIVVYMSDGSGSGPASADKKDMHSNELSQNPTTIVMPGKTAGVDIIGPAVANIDILPTFAEICGIQLNDTYKETIDGQSFAASLNIAGAAKWQERFYISDHQSTGERGDFNYQMALKPFNVTTVSLPNGKSVSWKSGKLNSKNLGPETIELAKAAYEKWMQRVLEVFPLGAYVQTHDNEKPVFLRSYPIVDAPGAKGLGIYFLLDVNTDGIYELDTNVSDYFGAEYKASDKESSVKLTFFKKISDEHLMPELDEILGLYKVPANTLAAAFNQVAQKEAEGKLQFELKAGRYLINIQSPKMKSSLTRPAKLKLRVQRKL